MLVKSIKPNLIEIYPSCFWRADSKLKSCRAVRNIQSQKIFLIVFENLLLKRILTTVIDFKNRVLFRNPAKILTLQGLYFSTKEQWQGKSFHIPWLDLTFCRFSFSLVHFFCSVCFAFWPILPLGWSSESLLKTTVLRICSPMQKQNISNFLQLGHR